MDPPVNVLLFNLATDADDPILGFTHDWIRALAARVTKVDVVTMRSGRLAVPANVSVYSVGKERGYSEPRRAVEFYRILRRLHWLRGYDACFAHMMPLFAVMAAPVLRARRIPLTLWYTHPGTTPLLRTAVRVADVVVTASPESVDVPTTKLVVTGHGIDTARFSPVEAGHEPGGRFDIVSVGRIAPIKGLEVIVDAASMLWRQLGNDLHVRFVGPVSPADEPYARGLVRRVADAGLDGTVEFTGSMARDTLPAVLRDSSVAVNLTPRGGFDKAVLEAMSCGTPVVTTNDSFRPLFEEAGAADLLVRGGADQLAATLLAVADLDHRDRVALGARLRQAVVDHHSLDRLVERLTREILVR
jgi:glycosyltransferase involved in cell wall biosynthesis